MRNSKLRSITLNHLLLRNASWDGVLLASLFAPPALLLELHCAVAVVALVTLLPGEWSAAWCPWAGQDGPGTPLPFTVCVGLRP